MFLHDMKGSDVPAVIGWENIVNLFIEINLIACFFPFEIHLWLIGSLCSLVFVCKICQHKFIDLDYETLPMLKVSDIKLFAHLLHLQCKYRQYQFIKVEVLYMISKLIHKTVPWHCVYCKMNLCALSFFSCVFRHKYNKYSIAIKGK